MEEAYAENRWYAVDIEKIMSPEDTGNLVRVESLGDGCYKRF